ACGTTPTIQPLPKKTPGPSAGQARPRKTFLVHPWPPARHQAAPRMPPAPKALEMSDKLIDAQVAAQDTLAAVFDRHPTTGSTKDISTGVNRVGQKIIHRRVDWGLPQQLMLP